MFPLFLIETLGNGFPRSILQTNELRCSGMNWIAQSNIIYQVIELKCKSKYIRLFPNLCPIYSEKAMASHSSTLAWKIPWTEEPGRLQSMRSRRVRHNWATSLSLFTFMHWKRKWQPTPVFLPGESQGWGRTESDTTEVT